MAIVPATTRALVRALGDPLRPGALPWDGFGGAPAAVLAEQILARDPASILYLYFVSPAGVILSGGTTVDELVDWSGNTGNATAAGGLRGTYAATGMGTRPGVAFAGGQCYTTPSMDLSAYGTICRTVAVVEPGDEIVRALIERSTNVGASAGGFLFASNNPGAWELNMSGFKGGYQYCKSQQLAAYDLTPTAVVSCTWEQGPNNHEVEVRHNGSNVTFSRDIDTNTSGGFGNYAENIGARSGGAALQLTGHIGLGVARGWASTVWTGDMVAAKVGDEVDAVSYYGVTT